MNREYLKDLVEIVGLIAIVGSLIFLALEVRQNTTALSADAWQARSEALQDLSMRMAESESLAAIHVKVISRPETCSDSDMFCLEIDYEAIDELSAAEFFQYNRYLTAHAFRLQNLWRQYELGLLTKEYYQNGVVGAAESFLERWRAFNVPQGLRVAESLGIDINNPQSEGAATINN